MKKLNWIVAALLSVGVAHANVGDTRIGVSGPISIVEGDAYWGLNFTVLHEVVPNLEIGGETGFHYRSVSTTVSTVSASAWIIPIMPTGIYRFEVSPTFTPFVGLGLGLGIIHVSASAGTASASATEAKFEGLAHLGARFGSDQNFFADIRLGLLSSSFVFIPSIGLFF